MLSALLIAATTLPSITSTSPTPITPRSAGPLPTGQPSWTLELRMDPMTRRSLEGPLGDSLLHNLSLDNLATTTPEPSPTDPPWIQRGIRFVLTAPGRQDLVLTPSPVRPGFAETAAEILRDDLRTSTIRDELARRLTTSFAAVVIAETDPPLTPIVEHTLNELWATGGDLATGPWEPPFVVTIPPEDRPYERILLWMLDIDQGGIAIVYPGGLATPSLPANTDTLTSALNTHLELGAQPLNMTSARWFDGPRLLGPWPSQPTDQTTTELAIRLLEAMPKPVEAPPTTPTLASEPTPEPLASIYASEFAVQEALAVSEPPSPLEHTAAPTASLSAKRRGAWVALGTSGLMLITLALLWRLRPKA